MVNKQLIVVAGGIGQRMNASMPKQFLPLKGKAILLHTLERLAEVIAIENLILVLPEAELARWKGISEGSPFENIKIAFGGETRFDSVKAGLQLIDPDGLVGIHDSVRPFVSVKTIMDCFDLAEKKGCGIPTLELTESIRRVFDGASRSENRDKYQMVQTPQCFQSEAILKAYNRRDSKHFTDDASVYEASGKKVYLVEGNPENIKITRAFDLRLAEALLG